MNWYLYHPISKRAINLFSDQVNEYTENELLSFPIITYQNPFTYIEDIDYQIMINLSLTDLKKCMSN